jgi:tetratricopeptide (TPR) repeat protein
MPMSRRNLWIFAVASAASLLGSAAQAAEPAALVSQLKQAQECLRQGKNGEARALFERVLQSSPMASGALQGLAEAQLGAGDVSGAEKSAWAILDQNTEDAAAWVLLARSAYAEGRYKKTLKFCQKALRYEPHYSPAYFWRGRAFEARGEPAEAKNEYHAATLCGQH